MQDPFADHSVGLTAPATRAETIVPDDGADLSHTTRALYVGQTGNVRVRTASGDIVTLTNVQGGGLYPIRIDRVFATGTSATNLTGLS